MRGVPFLERITIAAFFAAHFTEVREVRLNAETASELAVGDRVGVTFGGRKAATVSLPNPATRATVKNKTAFLAWMKTHFPEGVETVEQVRPDTQRAFLEQAKANDGKWLNTETGEYVVISGVEVSTADPSPRVELAADAADVIAEAWAQGEIREEVAELLRIIPAIPAGGGDDA